jgi:hypothetical protein
MVEKGRRYYHADKFTLQDLPRVLIPSKRMGYIIGGFFILSFILGLFTFPLGALMSGNSDLTMNFGWPMTFFALDSTNVNTIPIKFFGLIVDLLIYLSISYIIEIIINYFSLEFNYTFSENSKYAPKLYKK